MHVRFWGTRGSIATPGSSTIRYGGNTSCVQAVTDKGTLLVLDCGTGARLLGDSLMAEADGPMRGHIFLTHTHWDHIQGFPFFAPAFVPGNEWIVYGPADGEHFLEEALSGQMQYTYFPVELENIGASLECRDLVEGDFQLEDIHITARYLNHPAITLGYRFEVGGATLVYCTDHEPFSPIFLKDGETELSVDSILHAGDREHVEFLRDADLVIHDAQYTEDEYKSKRNWGHSTIEYVVQVASIAGVKRLALFHHDPKHSDTHLDALQDAARSQVRVLRGKLDVFAAREGDTLTLPEIPAIIRRHDHQHPTPPVPGSRRILIVDDDEMIRALVRDILRVDGYSIDTAQDGEEALSKIANGSFDLVLTDLRLPSIDGFEVLRRIRAAPHSSNMPVIMLTSASDAGRTERGFAEGASDYMTKPFSPSQLRARISEWLNRSAVVPDSTSH